ncbi:CASH domain-containing protein, partial [Candidatus Methanophagaceae archaeon]
MDVDKPLFLRGVDTGGGKPVVDAGGSSSSAITLSADWITLAGFWVINSGDSGVQINANHNTITGNIASNNEAGIILSDYSNNNIIASNTLSGNEDGIALGYFCDYNSVTGNTICNNNDGGIVLAFTSNNTITHNTVCNNEDGIYLRLTSDNKIYLNDFMNNSVNVDSMKSANIWDSPETIAYQYDSSNFTNYLGNFWDDYSGFDADNDGIGDTFYSIASDKDNYPLMQPWENYF